MPWPDDVKVALKANSAVLGTLRAQIDVLERRIKESLVSRAEYGLLESILGVGRIVAPVILPETGPIERFADVDNYSSYARCQAMPMNGTSLAVIVCGTTRIARCVSQLRIGTG